MRLARATLVLLAEEDKLQLVVQSQHTSASNTTQDVGTSTLEERASTLLGNDLTSAVDRRLVLDGLTRSHHHTTTDGVQRVRRNTGTSGHRPTQQERGNEVVLQGSNQDERLERVVHAEVQTTVDNDTNDGDGEATVQTDDTIRSQGLLVDVNQTVELTLTTALGRLGVVGQTGTGVVQRVDEQQRGGTGSLGRC